MEQLNLFEEFDKEEPTEKLSDIDYVLVKVDNGWKLVHSYYVSSREGTVLTAEEALECLRFCSLFNLYTVVTFNEDLTLPRRKH